MLELNEDFYGDPVYDIASDEEQEVVDLLIRAYSKVESPQGD